jgi:hypothetical protein
MGNRTRLFIRVVRWTPYVLAILLAISYLILAGPQTWEPFEGSIPFLYERIFYALMLLQLVGSAFAKGAVRSVLALISCASLFSTDLASFFRRLRDVPIRPPDGGPIYTEVWIQIAILGLFFVVVVIDAVRLMRSGADRR